MSLILQIIFTVLIDAISTVGKNGQQILSLILKQIKINAKLLTSFTTSGRVESALINHVQVCFQLEKQPSASYNLSPFFGLICPCIVLFTAVHTTGLSMPTLKACNTSAGVLL